VADATQVQDQYCTQLKALKKIDPSNRQMLIEWSGGLANSLDQLNDQGVLRIKNPQAKAKVSAALNVVRASAAALNAVIGLIGSNSQGTPTTLQARSAREVEAAVVPL
jgi:hypothetical protein